LGKDSRKLTRKYIYVSIFTNADFDLLKAQRMPEKINKIEVKGEEKRCQAKTIK
jgi:hypothetical protein